LVGQISNTENLYTVFVKILDEGTEVWRPVTARKIEKNVYELNDPLAASMDESWEFPNGCFVVCEKRQFESDGKAIFSLVAVAMDESAR
jgi:hypothetical protein